MGIFLFFVIFAHAQQTATVWSRHPSAVRQFFPPKHYRVLDSKTEAKEMEESGYVMPLRRDAIFQKLKFPTGGMDEFDKDLLIMSANQETLKQLVKQYPQFSRAQLAELQKEVRRK